MMSANPYLQKSGMTLGGIEAIWESPIIILFTSMSYFAY